MAFPKYLVYLNLFYKHKIEQIFLLNQMNE